jgi:hypothetical protein
MKCVTVAKQFCYCIKTSRDLIDGSEKENLVLVCIPEAVVTRVIRTQEDLHCAVLKSEIQLPQSTRHQTHRGMHHCTSLQCSPLS